MSSRVYGGSSPVTESTTGAYFYNGYSHFESPTTNGSWEYWGDLEDTTASDGHTPYMHAKIDGYAWNKEYGTAGGTLYQDHAWYSPGDAYVEVAYLVACNDNGSLDPDNCSPTKTFNYNGS